MSVDFDRLAGVYDELRPQNDAWWQRFDALVAAGDLRGRRVLDVGCGTGALATALVERAGAKVWGVEPSSRMIEVARARVPASVGLKQASAEALPFRDRWFERVVFSLSIHLVDRRSALAEAHRVLEPGGRVAIGTFAHRHFETYWAVRYFPSITAVDQARFPSEQQLSAELGGAGFTDVQLRPLLTREPLDRQTMLRRLHGRHISTFALLDPAEVEAGIARAERELPETVDNVLDQLVVTAVAG